MTSYQFFNMAADSYVGFRVGLLEHSRSTIVGPSLVYKSGVDRTFGDITI